MKYQGGKFRIASDLSTAMLDSTPRRGRYVEPFLGAASVFERMAPHFAASVGNDSVPDLVALWDGVYRGWVPPDSISEEEYAVIRTAPTSPLKGFCSIAMSFGGKIWGGYARGGIDYCGAGKRSILRTQKRLDGALCGFTLGDYRDVDVGPGDVVYCDPPYAGTTGFTSAGRFDTDAFWNTARTWADLGATVFVSEQDAPRGWDVVWSSKKVRRLQREKPITTYAMEYLFTYTPETLAS